MRTELRALRVVSPQLDRALALAKERHADGGPVVGGPEGHAPLVGPEALGLLEFEVGVRDPERVRGLAFLVLALAVEEVVARDAPIGVGNRAGARRVYAGDVVEFEALGAERDGGEERGEAQAEGQADR